MHHETWNGLRRVERAGDPGMFELREILMRRGLIEWVPGGSKLRLTSLGKEALAAGERPKGD